MVGAVAENQHHLHDNGIMQTPAGRASGLGRQVPGQGGGEFGPPGSGDTTGYVPTGGFGDYSDDDFVKPRKGRRWAKRSFYIVLALAVVGGGLYGGWRWTQTQYYVGTKGEHVALYRGISQDLAWVSLSKVEKDHPEIELKYLPPYQQKQVKEHDRRGRPDRRPVEDRRACRAGLRVQEGVRAQAAESENNSKTGAGEAGGTTGTTKTSLTSKASPSTLDLTDPVHISDRSHSQPRPQPLGG